MNQGPAFLAYEGPNPCVFTIRLQASKHNMCLDSGDLAARSCLNKIFFYSLDVIVNNCSLCKRLSAFLMFTIWTQSQWFCRSMKNVK